MGGVHRADSYLLPSEMEMAKARNQLDAVLQCLLEKSHMDRLDLVQPGEPWGWELFGLTLIVGGGAVSDGRLEAA